MNFRIHKSLFLLFIPALFVVSCGDDDEVTDRVFEFAHMREAELVLKESENSEPGSEIFVNAELLISGTRSFDVTLQVDIQGVNCTEGVDFEIIGDKTIVVPAGSYVSETGLAIRAINDTSANGDRSIIVTLTSSSDGNLRLGRGVEDPPELLSTTIDLIDDDFARCGIISFYDLATVDAASSFFDANQEYNFDDYTNNFSGLSTSLSDNCDSLIIDGDFLDWTTIDGSFTPTLKLALTPDPSDSTIGTLSFEEQFMGPMSDGFTYRMSTSGQDGSYNINNGTFEVTVFVDYEVNGQWVYWYTNTTIFTVQ